MPSSLDALQVKLDRAKADAVRHKRMYWKVRLAVIAHLGGKCFWCDETDITKLEVHHTVPTLRGGWKKIEGGGWYIMKEWKAIIEGKIEARLCCKKCHVDHEHDGNTNALKIVKKEIQHETENCKLGEA
jgi:hypothetical protein